MKRVFHVSAAFGLAVLSLLVTACDDGRGEHDPANGLGAIQVANNTSTGVDVYVDGAKLGKVDSYEDAAFDLTPGVHRVVLDETGDGTKSDSRDVDVLEGKTTVLDVSLPFPDARYDVVVFFE